MNDAARRAIAQTLANAEDDLARAKLQKSAMPSWRSGNGKTIDEVIVGYEKNVRELRTALNS